MQLIDGPCMFMHGIRLLLVRGIHGGCDDNERFFGLIYIERRVEEIFIRIF